MKKNFWTLKGLILMLACVGVGFVLIRYLPLLRIVNIEKQPVSFKVDQSNGVPALRIALDYPTSVHFGDTDTVKLVIDLIDQEWINSVTENRSILFEAKLVMDGVTVEPNNLIAEAYSGEGNPVFYWKITPTRTGKISGQAWVYLRPLERDAIDAFIPPISAQPIDIDVVDSFGFSATAPRVIGIILLLLSIALLLSSI